MDITISLATLFWLVSGIAAVYGLYLILRKPFVKLEEHEYRINKIEKHLASSKETDVLILKSLNAIANHMIDGGGIDKLREVRDELQQGIIESHN